MTISLSVKVVGVLVLTVALVFLPWVGMTLTAHVDALESQYRDRASSIAHLLDAGIRSEAHLRDREQLFSDLQRVLWLEPDILAIDIRALEDGELSLLLSTRGNVSEAGSADLALAAYETRRVRHLVIDDGGARRIRVVTPIRVSRQVLGTLTLDLTLEQLDANLRTQVQRWLLLGAVSLVLMGAALFTAMGRIVLLPIRRLTRAVEAFGRQEQTEVPDVRASDELGNLARAFQSMRVSLSEASAHVEHLAYHDQLTGLANRRRFLEVLEGAAADAGRGQGGKALVYVDLDGFKLINDSLGHAVGDELLIEIANRLATLCGPGDHLARIGGDEFAAIICVAGDDTGGARRAAEARARDMLEACIRPVQLSAHDVGVSASLGVRVLEPNCGEADDVLRDADAALSEAKRSGRNALVLYPERQSREALVRSTVRRSIHRALRDRSIDVHLQPQVDATGRIRGAEALLRWHVPGIGTLPAGDVVKVAEELGLTRELGSRVSHEACRIYADVALHRGSHPGLERLGLNASPNEFMHTDFAERLIALRNAFELPRGSIELELTEQTLVTDMERVAGVMRELRSEGFRIAVDDFGTGYSSFAYLKQLPIDTLKIDGSFVRDMFAGPSERSLVALIVTVGREFGLEVVAEGVQTDAQFDALRELGCDRFQGFLFGAAMPPEELALLLAMPHGRERGTGAGG